MNFIHYTKEFEKNIDESKKLQIYKKIEDLKFVDKPESLNSIDSFTKGMLVLKFNCSHTCRIIIQPEWLDINGNQVHVYFIRDYISNKGFDYFWGSVIHPQLRTGEWISINPLPNEEIIAFKNNYIKNLQIQKTLRPTLPSNLTQWLNDFKITLNFDVYERESWVLYSNDRTSNGL